jgi:hypothetical protein
MLELIHLVLDLYVLEDQLFDHVVTKIYIKYFLKMFLKSSFFTLDQSCLTTDCLLAILCMIISSSSVDNGNASSADISSVTTACDDGRAGRFYMYKI